MPWTASNPPAASSSALNDELDLIDDREALPRRWQCCWRCDACSVGTSEDHARDVVDGESTSGMLGHIFVKRVGRTQEPRVGRSRRAAECALDNCMMICPQGVALDCSSIPNRRRLTDIQVISVGKNSCSIFVAVARDSRPM